MAAFGLPGGAELWIIGIVMLVLGMPVALVALVVWMVNLRNGAAPAVSPAGWLADPSGRHQLRYWNGVVWTSHVADNGDQSEDAV